LVIRTVSSRRTTSTVDLAEEEGAVTEAEAVSVAGVASTTCMAASMDTCHSLQKISLWSQALQKGLQLMLPKVPKLCVKACPTVASTAEADTKEEGMLIPHPPLNHNLFQHNRPNHKENAASRLLTTIASVADRLHIQDQVLTAASVSTVSSRRIAKPELVDAKDVAAMKENTTTNLSTLTGKRTRQDPTPATKTHLEDHVVAEETEKSIVQLAKTAEIGSIAAVAADPAMTRTTAPPTTINLLVPRAVATETVREKKNVQIAIEAIVTVNALAEIAQPLPMGLLIITLLHAVHAAKTQLQPPTTKVSRSKARAQAPNPSLRPPVLAILVMKTEPTDVPVLPLSPYPKTLLPPLLLTHMPKNAKHVSKNVWLRSSKDVKVPLWEREIEVVSKGDGDQMLGMREREEARVGRLVIGMRMKRARKLGLRGLRGRGRLGDGGEWEGEGV
jgi:hypothetical protein